MNNESRTIKELYGYNLGIKDLRNEVIRLRTILDRNSTETENDTSFSILNTTPSYESKNNTQLNSITELHKSCIR